jgi:hypothetical protein
MKIKTRRREITKKGTNIFLVVVVSNSLKTRIPR